jgi:nucleotide-binding universal stress UspA family protein
MTKERNMQRILVPVDGSETAVRAVDCALRLARCAREPVELHLLTVQPPIVSGGVRMFFKHEDIEAYYQDSGQEALRAVRERLDQAGQAYVQQVRVGPIGETIADYAKELGCDQIVMGSRGLGAVSGMVLGSVATKVIHLTDVPVTLVK